jgi:crotonobetainyl-CoA:carnitine CoA-transferase CaiB-like acyl-CoA transferase
MSAAAPLDGVHILAIEQFGAGPWSTMLLADLGADVVKIENPLTQGDIGRYVPPYLGDKDSVYFQSFNRNKRSITLNLRHERAAEVLHPLVEQSDCVFNNLRGDLPAKMGLDYNGLKEANKSIVCASLSAFGRSSSRSSEPGYDYLMQGYAGWMSLTGEPDRPPQKAGLSLVDLSAGVMAALGLVSAILRARKSGIGCDIDVNLFDTALSELCYVGAWHLTKGYQPERTADSSHPSQVPSQLLPTSDGWLVVMCAKERFYQNLVRLIGLPELADDPRFRTFSDRLENREQLKPLLKQQTVSRTTEEWLRILRGHVPCAPVNSVEEAFRDPQVAEDDMIIETSHPEFGTVRQVNSPIRVSDYQHDHHRGPQLGEHTDDVLRESLKMTTEQIQQLREDGVL